MVNHWARFQILEEQSTPAVLVLRDLGPWDQFPTITNTAAQVVDDLVFEGFLPPERTLLYYDSNGRLDEIVHQEGRFVGFRPWQKREGAVNTPYLYSPQPWQAEQITLIGATQWKIRDATGRLVASLRSETEGDKPAQQRAAAHARLLARAPELEALCRRLLICVEQEPLDFEREASVTLARALLANLEVSP